MSKALVIKGASFLANRVEQISVTDQIPCTGITLSQDEITFSAIGETETLTVTLTPADTTETVTWVSSDEDVATVEDGVITCTGIGTATITVMCGTQSATCDVALTSVTIVLGTEYERDANTRLGGSVDFSKGKTYCSVASFTYASLFYSATNDLDGYKAFYSSGAARDDDYPIPIPQGASQISVTPSVSTMYIMLCVFDANEQASHRPDTLSTWSAKAVAVENGTGGVTLDLTNSPDANGFALSCNRGSSSASESDLSATVTVTFS